MSSLPLSLCLFFRNENTFVNIRIIFTILLLDCGCIYANFERKLGKKASLLSFCIKIYYRRTYFQSRVLNFILEMFSNNCCWFDYSFFFWIRINIQIYMNFTLVATFISFPIYLFFENCFISILAEVRSDASNEKDIGPSMSTIYNRSHNLIE